MKYQLRLTHSQAVFIRVNCSEINKKPFHPTDDDIKRASVRQYTEEGKSLRERTCPQSVFTKYMWATYCMTKGTIACFFCKKAKEYISY